MHHKTESIVDDGKARLSGYIEQATKDRLEEIARKERRSMNSLLQVIIDNYLEQYGG